MIFAQVLLRPYNTRHIEKVMRKGIFNKFCNTKNIHSRISRKTLEVLIAALLRVPTYFECKIIRIRIMRQSYSINIHVKNILSINLKGGQF